MQLSFLMKPPLPLFSNGLPSFNCHLSPAWSAIQCSFSSARLSVALNSSVRSKLGNGRTTRFWEDCWCGIVPLMSQFPRLYRLSTQLQATVCAVFYPTNNCFNLSWSRDLCESLIAEVERHFILHGGMDIKLRKHNTSGAYSTKSGTNFFYCILFPGEHSFPNILWKSHAPPKNDVLIWLLLHGSLSTQGFLASRGVIRREDARGPFCNIEGESINHLFLHCHVTWRLWTRFIRWIEFQGCIQFNVDQALTECYSLLKGQFQRQASFRLFGWRLIS